MTALDDFDLAASTVIGLVTAVRADQWALPTACVDWDVRAVVNHLAHGNAKVAFWAGTGPPAPDGDHLGASPVSAFAASVAAARAVLAEPGLFSRQVTTPLGEVPGVFLVHMRVNEYLAHGWTSRTRRGSRRTGRPSWRRGRWSSGGPGSERRHGSRAGRSARSSPRHRKPRRPTGWRPSWGGRG
ncbi:maleylpyruvate isomerase N-terminal domain-containing protein [Amycolatopsis plumensis]|uniref:Maleylpyruvate isomerase N-terminal domain-containing protein n=1 Tax=Amycolatopsis plumensis TaxID=236508 RepID=A0ABV5U285_9PSEU